jgi:hypothetical protein
MYLRTEYTTYICTVCGKEIKTNTRNSACTPDAPKVKPNTGINLYVARLRPWLSAQSLDRHILNAQECGTAQGPMVLLTDFITCQVSAGPCSSIKFFDPCMKIDRIQEK